MKLQEIIAKLNLKLAPLKKYYNRHKGHSLAYIICTLTAVMTNLSLIGDIRQGMVPELSKYLISDISIILSGMLTGYIAWQMKSENDDTKATKKALDAEKQANAAKSRFLANMSHEIRTPINAILGMDEMILRESEDEAITGYAKSIEEAGGSLLALINDILDFSKIESGEMTIVSMEYETGALFKELDTMFRMRADDKKLELKFDVDGRIPKKLYGDPLRVKQICMNLLSNAIKYTDKGEVVFTVRWEREKDGSAYITFAVRDTGKGIREEDLSKLFNKFQRLDLKNNNNIEGTGLGLAITKSLTEQMKGDITVESVYGSGSVFTATILQGVKDPEPLGDYKEYTPKRKNVTKKAAFIAPEASILAVDDTPLNLDVIKNLLKYTKAQVDTAGSGLECLEMTGRKVYDIILMDARMPHMDGTETLHALREKKLIPDTTKVIILTANALSGAREEYLKDGFDEYLAKPVRPDILEDTVRQQLPKEKVIEAVVDTEKPVLPDWIMHLKGLDTDKAMELCGTQETLVNTLNSFAQGAEDQIERMRTVYRSQDIETLTIKVHALKSSAALIGAMTLSDHARELEAAGNRQDTTYIDKHLSPLFMEYKRMAEAITEACPDTKPVPGKKKLPIESEDVSGIYRHLKLYVEEFNDEAASSMLRALSEYEFPDSEKERFNAIVAAHRECDWIRMSELLEERLERTDG